MSVSSLLTVQFIPSEIMCHGLFNMHTLNSSCSRSFYKSQMTYLLCHCVTVMSPFKDISTAALSVYTSAV